MVLGGHLGAKVGISPKFTYFNKNQEFYENPMISTDFNDFYNFPATMPYNTPKIEHILQSFQVPGAKSRLLT